MHTTKMTPAIFLFTSAIGWCADPPATKNITPSMINVSTSNNQFAAGLYSHLRSEETGNLFFSPYSISTALAMTSTGANGSTKSQMAEVLHFPKNDAELHLSLKRLRENLELTDAKSSFQLRVANRLWGQDGFQFLPDFLTVTKNNYGAELGLLDFAQAEPSRQAINTWVEKQTERKIQDLIPPGLLNESTRLVLTNAIYFKARWKDEFNKGATADAPFHVSGQNPVTVPFMNLTHRLPYFQSPEIQILEMPYGRDNNSSMLVLLPRKRDGLAALEKQLTNENLQRWSAGLEVKNVKVQLPRFKMTSQFSLKKVLSAMGMSLPFSDEADFSKMTSQERLQIAAVIHKAFVDVNEEGTEAAAATAVVMRELSALIDPKGPIEFTADHPFVFLIRHNPTKCLLFLGRVANPKT